MFTNYPPCVLWGVMKQVPRMFLTNRGLCGIARADKRDYFTKSALVKKKSFRQIKFFA